MRRQITEARLLARFKKLFGGPEETIVAIGDFDQCKHRKFKEPVKGKGFRALFRKAGYKVYPGGRVPTELRRRVGEAQDAQGVREPRDRIEPAVSCAMD
jgi:hypothetical protein